MKINVSVKNKRVSYLRIACLILFNTCAVHLINAQTPFDNILPPTPTASALMKFTDIPVSLYTGVPDIEIPLYEVKSKSLSMPITLKYHGGGVKVEEDPGWLGLSWALDAGGTISRVVMGKADELTNGYIEFSKNFPSTSLTSVCSWATYDNDSLLDMAPDPNESYSYMDYDTEPDIFYFNFPGHSGRFVFVTDLDGTTTIQTIPHQNIEIVPVQYTGSKYFNAFNITDETGTRYIFGYDGDRYGYDTNEGHGVETPVTCGWHLIDIISCDSSDSIKFTYTSTIENGTSHKLDLYDVLQLDCFGATAAGPCMDICQAGGSYGTEVSGNTTTTYISKIESSNCKVVFDNDYTPDRLMAMHICTGADTIRRFDFAYDNYTSNERFFLTSLTESSHGKTKPPYEFEYNDISLPLGNSNAVDYWGYYNGQHGNSYKIPSQWVGIRYYTMGNLEPSSTYVKAGSLTKISYPTGGYSEFTFEPNDYKLNEEETGEEEATKTVSASCTAGATTCCMGEGSLETDTIVIGKEQTVTVTVTISETMSGSHYALLDSNDYGESTTVNVILSAGTHTLQAHADCGGDVSITVDYIASTGSIVKNKIGGGLRIKKIVYYDGISHDNDRVKEYEYAQFADSSFSSGVLVSVIPKYTDDFYRRQTVTIGEYYYDYFCHYIRMTSNPSFTTGTINGSPVVYTNVTEYDGGKVSSSRNGKNGKTESTFSLTKPSIFDTFPYAPPISYDYQNGLLQKQTTYNSNGVKVKQENNTYDINTSLTGSSRSGVYGIKARFYYRGLWNPSIYSILRQCYSIPVGSALLSQRIDTLYDANGLNPVVNRENFSYSDFLLSKKTVTTSDNKAITSYIIYPQDYSGNTGFVGTMNDSHILKPVETVTYESDAEGSNIQVLGGTITEYKTGDHLGLPDSQYKIEAAGLVDIGSFRFSNSSSTGLPTSASSYSRNNTYYKKKYSFEYNEYGNLAELNKENDLTTTYLWGYDHLYPVAKIENATLDEVKTALGGSIPDPGNSGLDTAQASLLRSGLDAFVSVFDYAPLLGMTSSTDPNGVKTYYEYDDFGRLKQVKNNDSDIQERYTYHYPEDAIFTISSSSLGYTPEGGLQTVSISSNVYWTVTSDQTWLTVSPSAGSNDGSVSISCSSNSSTSSRIGTVALTGEGESRTITVSQTGVSLRVSSSTLSYTPVSSSQTVTVTSNVSWTASTSESWITLSPSSGSGDGSVSITCSQNSSTSSRSGTVTLTGNGISQTVTVSQTGVSLSVSSSSLSYTPASSSQTVTVTSNVSWTASTSESWITLSPSSGSGDGSVSVTCLQNSSTSSRSGTVTVTGNGISKTITVSQTGVSFTVSSSSLSYTPVSSSQTVTVTSNVSWTASTSESWITLSPSSGSGDGSVSVTCSQNSSTSSRSGTVILTGNGISQTVTVSQAGVSLSVSSSSLSYTPASSSQTVTVTSNVSWTASTSQSWITLSPASGSGSGSVSITCSQNSSTSSRSGTVTVTGNGISKTITVSQAGVSLSVSSSSLSYTPVSSSQTVTVTSNVSWTASTSESWITLSPSSGSGDGSVSVTCLQNSSTSSRSGTVTVTGNGISKTITVSQTGVSFTVSSSSLSYTPVSSSQTVTVTSNVSWTASTSESWITLSPSSGSGDGSVSVTCLQNSSTSSRSGTVTVTGNGISKTITVSQTGASLSVSSSSLSFTSSAGSSTFTISSNCSWSISDDASWLSESPTSGSGDETVTLTVSENTSSSTRTAIITITYAGGQTETISVSQDKTYTLTVSPASLTFSDGDTKKITITSNTTWTISASATWITVSSSSGTGNATRTITCTTNPSLQSSRTGTLTITGSGISVTVSITQLGRIY